MAAQPQQGGNGSDNSLGFLWGIVGLFVLGFIVWYFFQAQIIAGFFYLKLAELSVINLFTNNVDGLRQWIHGALATPGDVPFSDVANVATAVGSYIRIPLAVLLVVFAVLIYRSDVALRFRKSYDMQKLLEAEKDNWPQITPVTELDLIHEDIDSGKWAMAMEPLQFARKHDLIDLQQPEQAEVDVSIMSKIHPKIILRRSKANRIFAAQLGRPWGGVERLKIHEQALFAIFASRINRDRATAHDLLRQIGASTRHGKLNFAGTEQLLNKHKDSKLVKEVIKCHAYVTTVLASMLEEARKDGVIASADFLWVKPVDRRLWYVLNCVGRQTAYPECAGPFAHWLAEKLLGKRIKVPMVEEATKGFDVALQDILYTEEV